MEDTRKLKKANDLLYRLLSANIADLTTQELKNLANNMSSYGLAIRRVLDSQTPTQRELNDLERLQTNWYDDIHQTHQLDQQKQREDLETIVKVVNRQPEQRKISNDFLKNWRETFVQDMIEKHSKLLQRLPNLRNPNIKDTPQGLNIEDIQMKTEFFHKMFMWMDQYIERELRRFYIPKEAKGLTIIRNPESDQKENPGHEPER